MIILGEMFLPVLFRNKIARILHVAPENPLMIHLLIVRWTNSESQLD